MRVTALVGSVGALLIVSALSAYADESDVEPKGTAFSVHSQTEQSGGMSEPAAGSAGTSGGTWHSQPACSLGGAAVCVVAMQCDDNSPMTFWWLEVDGERVDSYYACPEAGEVAPPLQVTNAMVARAFKRIPLPASELIVQPPGGETLVNFATNFYTEAAPFERSVTLVGQRVDLRIRPTAFAWSFGDGAATTTSEPGAAYPALDITHEYTRAGQVGPSVDTTYSAEFRVNGGGWEPVVGTVTMAGEPVALQVRTASPTLVGYR